VSNSKELAQRIDQLFRHKGVSNAEAGRALGGITGQVVGRWRRTGNIREDNLRALAKYFGVSYYELKEGANADETISVDRRSRDFLGRERRRMIDEIIKDEERLRLVTRASNIGHWELDIPSNHFTASLEAEQMFGADPGELDGPLRDIDGRIHPEDLHIFYGCIQSGINDGMCCAEDCKEGIIRIPNAEGTIKWLRVANQVVSIGGSPTKMVGIFQDITKEKEIEIKEHRLSLAMDAAEIGSWDLNQETDDLIWSNRTKRIFGIAESAVNHLHIDDFNTRIHPDDVGMVWQAFLSAKERKRDLYQVSHRIMLDDGSIKWVRESGKFLYDSKGNATNVVGITQDISEQMERENLHAKMQTAMELGKIKIWENDVELDRISIMTDDGIDVKSLDDVFSNDQYHPDDVPKLINVMDRIIAGEDSITIEYREKAVNGEYEWHRTTSVAVRNEADRLVKIVGATHNIQAEKQHKETQEMHDLLFRRLPTLIVRCSSDDLTVSYVSPAVEKYGYQVEDFFGDGGMKVCELMHEKDRDQLLETARETIDVGKCEFSCKGIAMRHKSGKLEAVDVHAWIEYDDEENANAINAYITPVNNRQTLIEPEQCASNCAVV